MKIKISIAKIYLFFIFFTPCFFGYMPIQIGQRIYLFLYFFISIFLSLPFLHKKICNIQIPIIISLLIFFHYSISTIFNFSINNLKTGDIIEIYRPIIYVLTLLFALILLTPYVKKNGMWKCMDYIEDIVFYSSFFEFFKYFEITKHFFYLYTPFSYNSINYIRFFGVTGFAYAYAWILIICIVYHSVKTNGKLGFRFLYYSFLVLMTGSRTGIAALFVLYFFLFFLFRKIRLRIIFLIILFLLSILLLYNLEISAVVVSFDYILRLIQAFGGNTSDGSLVTRQSQINTALRRFYESPLYGTASNKGENVLIENFYFHHIGTWGLIGLILYFLWLSCFGIYLLSKKKRQIFFYIIIISFIICFSSPIFDQIRIFNIFYTIIAILMINSNNDETKKHKKS
jgi:hypothetical protein